VVDETFIQSSNWLMDNRFAVVRSLSLSIQSK